MNLQLQRTSSTYRVKRDCRVRPTAAASAAAADGPSTSGRLLDYRPTPDPPSVFVDPKLPGVEPWVRPVPETYTPPSVRDSGTLRPAAEWYPAWMRYRQREDNYVFWQDKFSRCSLDIPGGLHTQSCSLPGVDMVKMAQALCYISVCLCKPLISLCCFVYDMAR